MNKIYETKDVTVGTYFDIQKKTMCLNIFVKAGLTVPDAINLNRAIEKWINSQ